MSLRGKVVVVNNDGKFLSFDGIWFVDSDCTFYTTGSYTLAIRTARLWWKNYGTKPSRGQVVEGRRVFVVVNYGFEDEERREVDKNGRVGEPFYPNEGQTPPKEAGRGEN